MTKTELVAAVAEKGAMTKANADAAVKAVFDAMTDAMKNGDKVQVVGFGSFEVVEKAESQSRNPATGEAITVPAHKAVKFKAGKALKDVVNQ